MTQQPTHLPRKGLAAIWALIVLAVITTTSAAVFSQFAWSRRQLDGHQTRIQVDFLLRAGDELAMARILEKPDGYTGETKKLLPQGEVKIRVERDPKEKNLYRINTEVRYAAGQTGAVVRTTSHLLKRVENGKEVRVELVSEE